MNDEYPQSYLKALFDYSYDLQHVRGFGVNHAEPIFSQVWKVLVNNKNTKDWFINLVKGYVLSESRELVKGSLRPEWYVDDDLICFIVHASRWDEFNQIGEAGVKLLEAKGFLPGNRDISHSILKAMNDNWEDRDFYIEFR